MERYTYFDGGKWRMRVGDAEYSGKETERLAAYEETGLKPEAVEHLKLASLRAAGWKCVGQAGGLRWTGRRRPEVDLCPAQMKLRWEIGEEAALNDLEAEHDR